jgi:nitroimidazol reductase NimA-like FMN-containing flavoprotein (pyridoxamine 5'-phosphate oxidase superfamily)
MENMTSVEIEAMLNDTLIGRLSMADAQGQPYTIPLPFCFANAAIYVRIPLTGRKGEILQENDRVCFEIDRYSDSLDDYASVLVEGRLVEVTSEREKRYAKHHNDEKYQRLRRGYRPGHGRSASLGSLPVRRIVIERAAGRKKSSPIRAANSVSSARSEATIG